MLRCCATRRNPTSQAATTEAVVTKAKPESSDWVKDFVNAAVTPKFWEHFDKTPLHLPGVAPTLPDSFDLDRLVAAFVQGSNSGSTAAFKHGEPYMRDSIFLAYLDQATLSLNEAERVFPALLELCDGLAPAFDYVTATVLLHPITDSKVPPVHSDGDVLMVQLWGSQSFTLVRRMKELRVSAKRPEPFMTATLEPGDAIYVPRNAECRLETHSSIPEGKSSGASSSQISLFVLLTVRGPEQGFGVSLSRHFTDALRSGELSKESDAFFRSAVTKNTPLGRRSFAGVGKELPVSGKDELKAELAKSASEVASKLSIDSLRTHYRQRMEKLRKEQHAGAVKALHAEPLPRNMVTTKSRVAVAQGVQCRCTPGDDAAMFKRGGEVLRLPIGRTASYMISELCDGRPHVLGALPCSDPVERLCVAQVLIFKECLEIAEPGGDPQWMQPPQLPPMR